MSDYLHLNVQPDDLRAMSSLALAHMGDAVYEILARGWLCTQGRATCGNLHKETVALVRAEAQAAAVEKLLPCLTEAERAVYRRGYTRATGLEALFGWLYLQGQLERINQLFGIIMEEKEG